MSKTFDLVCRDCQIRHWIGQQNAGTERQYIYTTDAALAQLNEFLFSHQYHKLEFGEDQYLDDDDYTEAFPDESEGE